MSSGLQSKAGWESSIPCILYKQLFVRGKPIPSNVRLSGQTAVVTGSNSGLGFEAARQLLQLDLATIVLAVRSQTKGEAAASRLQKEFPLAEVQVSTLDMSDYDSVTAFAKRAQDFTRLDIVILNAGTQNDKFEIVPETKHESTFQTNYLSTALLSMLLVPIMKAKKRREETGRPPVLSVVGSDTMYLSNFDPSGPIISRFDDPARFDQMRQYMNTKLLLMIFISKLAEVVPPEDVLINVCNPGMTAGTNLQKHDENSGFAARYIAPIFIKALGRSTQLGARMYLDAVLLQRSESHGSFVSEGVIKPYARIMYTNDGKDLSDRLWRETIDELSFAGVNNVLH